jgi:hypothetical protein
LQSVSLGHREALTVPVSPQFAGNTALAPSTGRLRDNVVTIITIFNKMLPPPPLPSAIFCGVASCQLVSRRQRIERNTDHTHDCGAKRKQRLSHG